MKREDFTSEQARWQAVERRDAQADERFVFAVVTTGIFCRPSCRARRPLPQARWQPGFVPASAASLTKRRLNNRRRCALPPPAG